jgi:hypothetical protein
MVSFCTGFLSAEYHRTGYMSSEFTDFQWLSLPSETIQATLFHQYDT